MLKRVGYYLIGVALGSIIVLFVWQGKDVSFPYGPNARTLRSIQKKHVKYSESAQTIMAKSGIDTTSIKQVILSGDVNFGKSKPRLEPCAEYYISGTNDQENISIYVKRCDSIATIQTIWVKN